MSATASIEYLTKRESNALAKNAEYSREAESTHRGTGSEEYASEKEG